MHHNIPEILKTNHGVDPENIINYLSTPKYFGVVVYFDDGKYDLFHYTVNPNDTSVLISVDTLDQHEKNKILFYLLSILPRKSHADLIYYGGFTPDEVDRAENWRDNRNDALARLLVAPKKYEASIDVKIEKSSIRFGEESSHFRIPYDYEEDLLEECDCAIYKGLGKLHHFKFVE